MHIYAHNMCKIFTCFFIYTHIYNYTCYLKYSCILIKIVINGKEWNFVTALKPGYMFFSLSSENIFKCLKGKYFIYLNNMVLWESCYSELHKLVIIIIAQMEIYEKQFTETSSTKVVTKGHSAMYSPLNNVYLGVTVSLTSGSNM